MNKLRGQVVSVRLGRRNRPAAFEWNERIYPVRKVLECWRLTGAWWNEEGEKTFFRVRTESGGIYDLCFDHSVCTWSIEVVQD